MSDHIHVMVDLETLGTVPGCIGFSAGCVEFFPETQRLGREYYVIINVDSSIDHYLREDPDTKQWWKEQSDEAKIALNAALDGEGKNLREAMEDMNSWFSALGSGSKILLYGNGADFDNPILRCMYDAADIQPHFKGYGGRCYRTLKNLEELFGPKFRFNKLTRVGTHHNALDDAKNQAKHLMENIARIKASFVFGDEE